MDRQHNNACEYPRGSLEEERRLTGGKYNATICQGEPRERSWGFRCYCDRHWDMVLCNREWLYCYSRDIEESKAKEIGAARFSPDGQTHR